MRFLLVALLLGGSAQAPPFDHSVSRITKAELRYSWRPGCPVAPAQLRRIRLTYWGFDRRARTGTLVAHSSAVGDVVKVFSRLYAARFPIRRMRPVDVYVGDDRRSMGAGYTSAFNWR